MNEGMTSAEVVRSLAAAYARLRRGEVTDREAYADAVVLRDRLKKIAGAGFDRGRPGDKIVVVEDSMEHHFQKKAKLFTVHRPGMPAVEADTIEEVDAILGTTGIPDSEAIDQLEDGVVRRRLRGVTSETAAKRELFIIRTMKEAVEVAGGVMPEVIHFKFEYTVADKVDPSKPKGPPFKVRWTA